MLITTKGRYALRMMLNIAGYGVGNKIALRKVAEEEGISLKYLEQLAHALVEKRVLLSARGHGGGYALAKPAEKIKIGDILRAVEGETVIAACTGLEDDCKYGNGRLALPFWEGLNDSIEKYLDGTTLADLLKSKA